MLHMRNVQNIHNYGADFFREGFGLKPSFEIPRSATELHIFKASQPRGWASGSRAYERHEMQGVILVLGMNALFL